MGTIIAENENYVLTKPYNSWDTNYHLLELSTDKEYLIDIHDVHDYIEDVEVYGGMLFKDMLELDIDEIKENAWKVI